MALDPLDPRDLLKGQQIEQEILVACPHMGCFQFYADSLVFLYGTGKQERFGISDFSKYKWLPELSLNVHIVHCPRLILQQRPNFLFRLLCYLKQYVSSMLKTVWEHIFEIATLKSQFTLATNRRYDFLMKAKNILGFLITMASDL